MQDEHIRRSKGTDRPLSLREKVSPAGTVRAKRLAAAGFWLLLALLFTGTALFPGTYPLGIALTSAAGGLLSAAAVTVGALIGSVRIPAAGGVYALVIAGLFAVRALTTLWLSGEPSRGSISPKKNGGTQSGVRVLSTLTRAGSRLRRLFNRILEIEEEDSGSLRNGASAVKTSRSGTSGTGLSSGGSGPAVRSGVNAGTVLREHIRIRMALSACAALFAGAWSVVAGGYEYADLFGAVFSVLTTPLCTYLFYAASDRNMRASPFREFGVYALMTAAALSLHGLSASLFSLRLPAGGGSVRTRILFDAGAFFALAVSLLVTRSSGWQRGAVAGVLCGLTMEPAYVPMYALSAVVFALLERLPEAFPVLGAGAAAVSWAVFTGGIDGFTFVIPPVLVLCAVLIPLFRYDAIRLPEDLFGTRSFLSAAGRDKAGRDGERTAAALRAEELDRRVKGLSEGLASVSAVLFALSDRLSKPSRPELRTAVEESFSEKCARCPRKTSCRMGSRDRAEALYRSMTESLVQNGFVSASLIPPSLASGCPDMGDILDRANRVITDRAEDFSRESRLLNAAEDWGLAGELFRAAEERGREAAKPDAELEKKLRRTLSLNGFTAASVRAWGGRTKIIRADGVDLYSTRLGGDDIRRLFEGIVRLPLSQPEFQVEGSSLSMRIHSVSAFFVRGGSFSCAASGVHRYWGDERSRGAYSGEKHPFGRRWAGGDPSDHGEDGIEAQRERIEISDSEPEDVCGDITASFEADGRFYMILSDGMGSGREAALSAGMAVSILEKLIRAGAGMDTSLKMLNQILRAAGRECPATVDAAEIDLTTGEARFVKSGAAPSFVLRDGSVFRLQSKTVPIGILRALDAEMIRFDVREGDTVVMVSDGAAKSFDEEPWLLDLLTSDEEILHGDEKRAAMTVVGEAAVRGSKDDITCGVFRILKKSG